MPASPAFACKTLWCTILFAATSFSSGATVVYTTDFIPDDQRIGYNNFESMPLDDNRYAGGTGPYVFDGISVEQVDGGQLGNPIWVGFTKGGGDGDLEWYPNTGDNGYTRISILGGGEIFQIGMLVADGSRTNDLLMYQLWNEGALVLEGAIPEDQFFYRYLGFGGGGFDTVLLRSGTSDSEFFDGSLNALAVDGIELGVPEPSSSILFVSGVAVLFGRRRRRNWSNRVGAGIEPAPPHTTGHAGPHPAVPERQATSSDPSGHSDSEC